MKQLISLQSYKDLIFLPFSVYLKKEKILAFADFHLSLEYDFAKEGIYMPVKNLSNIKKNISFILDICKKNSLLVKSFLINGDLKHSFSYLSNKAKEEISELISFLDKDIVFIKGNHDTFLKGFLKKKGFDFIESYESNNYFFCHGDKIYKTDKIKIIGHEHPSVSIKRGSTYMKYKSFILDKDLIVMPSMNTIAIGSDFENFLSPFLKNKDNKAFSYILQENNFLFYFKELF